MAWGRRVFDTDTHVDFTGMNEGDTYIWRCSKLVKCNNCGRIGCDFGWGVVHSVNKELRANDACLNDVPSSDAHTIFYDKDGNETMRWKKQPLGNG